VNLSRPTAEIFVPDHVAIPKALSRTTHLCIAAHPDDIEIMDPQGILECFDHRAKWFTGVVVTDGSGSPRSGRYAKVSDAAMRNVRRMEQKKAAELGRYSAVVLLDHSSASTKSARQGSVRDDLSEILRRTNPDVVVTHALTDKHDTHVAVALRTIEAIRALPASARPKKLYGSEVWRDLDWMFDDDKVVWDVSDRPELQAALVGVFGSQVRGGKRYDLAVIGRRWANATFHESHKADAAIGLQLGIDLTPLARNVRLNPLAYAERFVEKFRRDVGRRIRRFL
jgi:LmbE family N-acetylglucosaminyl deacetylase